ncbi:hypothetical protein DNAM_100 [Pseudomonas phage BroderSalsa]|nr:hypothetical protein DNAM_100 [Pseudomonas phage BroderSalsa]
MAIATYDDLLREVRSWSNRNDLTDEQIYSFLYYAGSAANQVLRVPAMENTEILTVSEGGKLVIPPSFLELRSLTAMTGSDLSLPLERVAWDQFINYRRSDNVGGQPRYFSRQGAYLFLTPAPPDGTQVTCHYYAAMPDINPTEQLNWLSDLSPMAYLYGALHFAFLFLMDEERSEYWKGKFQTEVERIQNMSDSAEYAGSALVVRSKTTGGIV